MGREDRPMLNTEGQIAHLKSKGVKFEHMSEEEAAEYPRQTALQKSPVMRLLGL